MKEPDGYFGKVKETMWSVWPTWECWNWKGHEGKSIDVEVYSSYPKVRLYLNDKLVGERSTTRAEEFKAVFGVQYEAGTLKAVGVDSQGNEVESRTLSTSGEAVDIRLTADGKLNSDEQDVCFITAELIDKNGVRVQDAEQDLHFEVKGNATLIATGSADLKDTVSYTSSTRKTYKGMAMGVVRSNGKSGIVKVTVSGKGIKKQIVVRGIAL